MARASQPGSRMADGNAAQGCFDSVVDRYAVNEEITLSTSSVEHAVGSSAAVTMDAATLSVLQNDQAVYHDKQLKLLANDLKFAVEGYQSAVESEKSSNETSPSQGLGPAEHGENYEGGIFLFFD